MNSRRLTAGFAAAAILGLLGACADEADDPGQTPSPSPQPPVEEIQGEVFEGVEAGCILLRTDQDDYLLIGEEADVLASGETAAVRGHADPHMVTTCQQGTPFVVDEVVAP